jgi:hypothetical protein
MEIADISRLRDEDRLLLWACGGDRAERADDVVSARTDWNYLITMALRNRVIVPLSMQLGESSTVPREVRRRLVAHRQSVGRAVAHAKASFEQVVPAIVELTDVILLRGIAYAYTLYRDHPARRIGDIDLLVNRPTTYSLSGWLADHHHVPRHIQGRCAVSLEFHVDLNVNSSWCSRVGRLRMAQLWERRQFLSVAGCTVGTLAPEDNLVYLAYHNVAKGFVGLYRFVDLIALIRTTPPEWDVVIERARTYKVARALWINSVMINVIRPGTVPDRVINTLEPSHVTRSTIGRLFSVTRVMHDPNVARRYGQRTMVPNAAKSLLVRAVLIRPATAHNVLFGTAYRHAFRWYGSLFRLPFFGPLLERARDRLQHRLSPGSRR